MKTKELVRLLNEASIKANKVEKNVVEHRVRLDDYEARFLIIILDDWPQTWLDVAGNVDKLAFIVAEANVNSSDLDGHLCWSIEHVIADIKERSAWGSKQV